jgi:hypothetical protein
VAEWSKALRPGRSLFGGVGSNPTLTTFCWYALQVGENKRGPWRDRTADLLLTEETL